MNAAQKKAFVARMAKARAAKRRKPATRKAAARKRATSYARKPRAKAPARKRRNGLHETLVSHLSHGQSLKRAKINLASQHPDWNVTAEQWREAQREVEQAKRDRKAEAQYGSAYSSGALRGSLRPNGKRNPGEMEAAEAMYTDFHGRPCNRIIEYDQPLNFRGEVAELGKLLELRYEADDEYDQPLTSFGNCQVTCTPDGKNLYIVGGKQAVDLDSLNIASDKDYVELGPLTYIKYHTQKGFHDFQPIDYYHQFGEENGILPVLAYDQLNKALFILGGDYVCKPEGITN